MNPEAGSPKEALPVQTPYEIRAHHLPSYAALIQGDETPAVLAEESVKYLADNFKDVTPDIDLDALRVNDQSDLRYKRAYRYDNIGHTQEQAQAVQEIREQVFQEFMDLPDDAVIKITESPDETCKRACFIGDHCSVARGQVNDDRLALSVFNSIAQEKGFEDNITVVSETAEVRSLFVAGPFTVNTKAIVTTKGTLREVFKLDKKDGENDDDLYKDVSGLEDNPADPITQFRMRMYNLGQSIHGSEALTHFVKNYI